MGGYDPYSNSKGCSELVTSAYRNSFFSQNNFEKHGVAVASARAGNVIGGGDWAQHRLIPDFIRSITTEKQILIRNPHAIRPWQHVLEPLTGYLLLCEKLFEIGPDFSTGWNFGADDNDAKDVLWIIQYLCDKWGDGTSWEIDTKHNLHEAMFLKLDCSKAKAKLGWSQFWNLETTLKSIIEWNKSFIKGEDMRNVCYNQINDYYNFRKI